MVERQRVPQGASIHAISEKLVVTKVQIGL